MPSIKTGNMYSIPSFDAAKRHYERTPHPRARSRGDLLFKENERPLDGDRQWHKRMSFNANDGSYSVWLYETEMLRYFAPDAAGRTRALVAYHGSTSSSAFMWRHGWSLGSGNVFDTAQGKVWVPLSCNARHPYEYWAADLVLDERRLLLPSESWHVPLSRAITSPERRRERRAVAKHFAHLVKFAAQTASLEWRPCAIEPRAAIHASFYDGNKDAEGDVLQWLIACNQDATALNNRLCNALRLYVKDVQEPLPMFMPAADAPKWRAARNLRPAG